MSTFFKEVTLGEVCLVGDGAHSKVTRTQSGIMYLTSKNIGQGFLKLDKIDYITIDSFDKLFPKSSNAIKRPQAGDILFGIIGTFGNLYLYKENDLFGFSSSIGILRPNKEKISSEYLYHVMNGEDFKNNHSALNAGSVQGYTNIATVKSLRIPLPSLNVQKNIAKILTDFDEKIHLNNQINQTLESIAQAIFKSWFIDFEPVRAKIAAKQEGKDPEFAAMCAISGKSEAELKQMAKEDFAELQATAALFPDELVESELGDVPKGWEVKEASSIFNISIGKTPPRKEPYWFSNYSDDIKWLSIKDMGNNGLFTKETSEYLTHQAIAKFNIKVLPRNTVLLSFKLTVGRVVISNSEITTNEAIAHFFSDKIPYFWTYLYLRNFDFSKLGSTSSIATAINSKIIKDMPFLVVDTMILRVFEKNVSTFFETIRNNEVQNSNLMNVRDTLLPKLLSGELDVSGLQGEGIDG